MLRHRQELPCLQFESFAKSACHLHVPFLANLCKREFGEFVPSASSGPWPLCGVGKEAFTSHIDFISPSHSHSRTPGVQAVPPQGALFLEMGGSQGPEWVFHGLKVDTGRQTWFPPAATHCGAAHDSKTPAMAPRHPTPPLTHLVGQCWGSAVLGGSCFQGTRAMRCREGAGDRAKAPPDPKYPLSQSPMGEGAGGGSM